MVLNYHAFSGSGRFKNTRLEMMCAGNYISWIKGEAPNHEGRSQMGEQQPEEKDLVIHVKTLRFYSAGNGETLQDFGAED